MYLFNSLLDANSTQSIMETRSQLTHLLVHRRIVLEKHCLVPRICQEERPELRVRLQSVVSRQPQQLGVFVVCLHRLGVRVPAVLGLEGPLRLCALLFVLKDNVVVAGGAACQVVRVVEAQPVGRPDVERKGVVSVLW